MHVKIATGDYIDFKRNQNNQCSYFLDLRKNSQFFFILQLDVVLAAAHALESNSSGGNPLSEFGYPCAEKLIDELIFHIHDVVNIEILDVNLGYAEGK